jgi:hypothetical protein
MMLKNVNNYESGGDGDVHDDLMMMMVMMMMCMINSY